MQRYVRLTEERFTELMKGAYEDGVDDGHAAKEDMPHWEDSVTKDTVDHEIKQARNG